MLISVNTKEYTCTCTLYYLATIMKEVNARLLYDGFVILGFLAALFVRLATHLDFACGPQA